MTRTLLALLLCPVLCAQEAPRVATHYFYWYRWPEEHFRAGREGREGHLHHFVHPEKVSYLDPDWHERQFRAMAASRIDFALPVYWGAPGAYERPGIRFSRQGLGPMVTALKRLEKRAAPRVALGLFYDTSTLLHDVRGVQPRGGKPDLTEREGKDLFCGTVVEYFERIPPRFWARMDGRALVVLYVSAFARKWDAGLGPAVRTAFAKRFPGEGLFLVADASWGDIGQDRTTSWGAALHGPRLFAGIAQIGPGYDDSPVPGRRTPVRDREAGNFYRYSWRAAIRSKPELVLIETWNEMHEGTEICETKETERFYLDLTAEWVGRLRAGKPGPEIELARPDVRSRPDTSWGAEARGAAAVRCSWTGARPRRFGLREVACEDGPIEVREGRLRSRPGEAGVRYLYFQVSDAWRFDEEARLLVAVEVDGQAEVSLEYDSWNEKAILSGSYAWARRREPRRVSDAGTELVFELPDARLANRQNVGADFRLVVRKGAVAVRRVEVREMSK